MTDYDAIVVGARVAGSPTAMLLARRGYRVLLVDRATFPSDTMSTHLIHPPGMAALQRWGLAEQVIATGCPPVHTYRLDFGPFAVAGQPRGLPGATHAYAPRRVVLDSILLEAAARAGAEVRESFSVESLIVEDEAVRGIRGHTKEGATTEDRGRVVIGADGTNSFVARHVGAGTYNEVPPLQAMYYSYWSDFPADGEFRTYVRGDRALVTVPTNDDLTVVLVAWPIEEFEANKVDLLGNYLTAFEAEPTFAERARGATRETRLVGTHMQNFYRRSHGPGWALVGDAGYQKDAGTAQGISDAFRDTELLVDALDTSFAGQRRQDEALAEYQDTRDRLTKPMYDLTCQFASFEPPPEEEAQLFVALAGSVAGAEDFASMLAGTMPVQEFFDPENIGTYLSAVVTTTG